MYQLSKNTSSILIDDVLQRVGGFEYREINIYEYVSVMGFHFCFWIFCGFFFKKKKENHENLDNLQIFGTRRPIVI